MERIVRQYYPAHSYTKIDVFKNIVRIINYYSQIAKNSLNFKKCHKITLYQLKILGKKK